MADVVNTGVIDTESHTQLSQLPPSQRDDANINTNEYWNTQRSPWALFRGGLSEDDGKPSASRINMMYMGVVGSLILITIFYHIIFQVKDKDVLALWLEHLPIIIMWIIILMVSAYGVNQGTAIVNKLLGTKTNGTSK